MSVLPVVKTVIGTVLRIFHPQFPLTRLLCGSLYYQGQQQFKGALSVNEVNGVSGNFNDNQEATVVPTPDMGKRGPVCKQPACLYRPTHVHKQTRTPLAGATGDARWSVGKKVAVAHFRS